jgi:hypothetical protein
MHIFDSNGIFVQLHRRHEYISVCRLHKRQLSQFLLQDMVNLVMVND